MAKRIFAGCFLARRLVESGVTFVEVVMDGWDTHQDNFGSDLRWPVDKPFATLVTDPPSDARQDACRLDGRIRPDAEDQRQRRAATISPRSSTSPWPAAGSRRSR